MEPYFAKVAVEAVRNAEEVLMSYFLRDGEIPTVLKPDRSPVTLADRLAEEAIRETILRYCPDHGFIGEEYGKEKDDEEYVWIIDPIYGTKNFLRKIPLFATQLALMQDEEIVLGVSNAPAMHEFLFAEKGKGTRFNSKRVNVSSVNDLGQAMVCYGSLRAFRQEQSYKGMLELLKSAKRDRGFGDFYMGHLVATGRADILIEPAISIWDIAALKILVEEAGGKATDLQGYDVGVETSSFVATNGLLHEQVLNYVKNHGS